MFRFSGHLYFSFFSESTTTSVLKEALLDFNISLKGLIWSQPGKYRRRCRWKVELSWKQGRKREKEITSTHREVLF